MVEKKVTIDGKEVNFRASAATPRLYRAKFRRDLMMDMQKLATAKDARENGVNFSIGDLETFENVAYIMAYQGNPDMPATIEEWLDQFPVFSIYEILPELLDLWGLNMETTNTPKNPDEPSTGK